MPDREPIAEQMLESDDATAMPWTEARRRLTDARRFGGAGGADSSAAKWGMLGLTKALAREYGPVGIRANAGCPTFVDTLQVTNERFLREVLFPDNLNPSPADVDALAASMHPLAVGMLPPAEVARAVAFLLSDDARYLTGVVLDVAAGWNASWAAWGAHR